MFTLALGVFLAFSGNLVSRHVEKEVDAVIGVLILNFHGLGDYNDSVGQYHALLVYNFAVDIKAFVILDDTVFIQVVNKAGGHPEGCAEGPVRLDGRHYTGHSRIIAVIIANQVAVAVINRIRIQRVGQGNEFVNGFTVTVRIYLYPQHGAENHGPGSFASPLGRATIFVVPGIVDLAGHRGLTAGDGANYLVKLHAVYRFNYFHHRAEGDKAASLGMADANLVVLVRGLRGQYRQALNLERSDFGVAGQVNALPFNHEVDAIRNRGRVAGGWIFENFRHHGHQVFLAVNGKVGGNLLAYCIHKIIAFQGKGEVND
ncbi:MAG: hypothetical protein BWY80_00591 [Firmicutes bacterium ADurb.Bin456]|nr:MAG: hypothetical protein BWY80_00591 [Firmicutes bacterium ADurb.Bin456]